MHTPSTRAHNIFSFFGQIVNHNRKSVRFIVLRPTWCHSSTYARIVAHTWSLWTDPKTLFFETNKWIPNHLTLIQFGIYSKRRAPTFFFSDTIYRCCYRGGARIQSQFVALPSFSAIELRNLNSDTKRNKAARILVWPAKWNEGRKNHPFIILVYGLRAVATTHHFTHTRNL